MFAPPASASAAIRRLRGRCSLSRSVSHRLPHTVSIPTLSPSSVICEMRPGPRNARLCNPIKFHRQMNGTTRVHRPNPHCFRPPPKRPCSVPASIRSYANPSCGACVFRHADGSQKSESCARHAAAKRRKSNQDLTDGQRTPTPSRDPILRGPFAVHERGDGNGKQVTHILY